MRDDQVCISQVGARPLPLALFLLNQLLPGTNLVFILVLVEVALLIFLGFRLVRLHAVDVDVITWY